MMRIRRIARLAALLAPLSLTACNCPTCDSALIAYYQQLTQSLQAGLQLTASPAASTLSQDATDLTTDPWWGGNPTAGPMAPSN